ncbi:MAG TPA: hypothetical protein VLH16_01805, partial [Bacteroidales bacterium]|nr:hypothetical protein [Bacteroidales bacterium]
EKNGLNMMVERAKLSDTARKMIAGILHFSKSLTAFGNTIPTSYLRLVPHQEAPTNICWGDRNRSVLVRVPLGWIGKHDMINHANPLEAKHEIDFSDVQTVEFRCPDGSADVYLTIAGLTVAARHGLEMGNALEYAARTYVDVNIFHEEHKHRVAELKQLPDSCAQSAEMLNQQREHYMKYGVFPESLINGTISKLKAFGDRTLRADIKNDNDKILRIVEEYYHCG